MTVGEFLAVIRDNRISDSAEILVQLPFTIKTKRDTKKANLGEVIEELDGFSGGTNRYTSAWCGWARNGDSKMFIDIYY